MASQTAKPGSPELYADDSRFERIEGRLVERSLPTDEHSDVQFAITTLLKPIAAQLGAQARQEWSIAHGDDYMTPDVLMSFPGEYQRNKTGYLVAPAFLCVEVISPGQTPGEMVEKAERYYKWGVSHCWIIDPRTKVCLEYHGGNQITIAREFLLADQVQVKIADIFP